MRSTCRLLCALLLALPLPARAACVAGDGSGFRLQGEEAVDLTHGLTWKRCALGMDWDAASGRCTGEAAGLRLPEALERARGAGAGWHVPTGPELETLLLDTCAGPKVDTTAFPDIAASDFGEGAKFWTATEAIPDMFYFFDLTHGFADMHSHGYHLSVLLVK